MKTDRRIGRNSNGAERTGIISRDIVTHVSHGLAIQSSTPKANNYRENYTHAQHENENLKIQERKYEQTKSIKC